MVGVFFHYFTGQASSQILTVTKREGLLIWGSLADIFYNYREEERKRIQNFYIPSIVPEMEEGLQHSLDSWYTSEMMELVSLTESLWQLFIGVQSPAQVPAPVHYVQWSFLFSGFIWQLQSVPQNLALHHVLFGIILSICLSLVVYVLFYLQDSTLLKSVFLQLELLNTKLDI